MADVLSRKGESFPDTAFLLALTFPTANWLDGLHESYHEDSTKEFFAKWDKGEQDPMRYALKNGILSYKGRLFVGGHTNLWEMVI